MTGSDEGTMVSSHSAPAPVTHVSTGFLLMCGVKDATTQQKPVITVASRKAH